MDGGVCSSIPEGVAMKSISEFKGFYIHRAPVDMRKSINGLAAIVEADMNLSLRSSSLFIFCNSRRTHLKILYFDRSGFALWFKRLEDSKFPWPTLSGAETIAVSIDDLQLLLDGVNVWTRFEEVHFERFL
ncbi:MAG: IS66 family insertion sequence element accessory protein TnpB [Bdellovibrionales bacterium]|nr:IS66 family insertion sequence element accessory protein TnpB [Bdellovibrionales bacterium]